MKRTSCTMAPLQLALPLTSATIVESTQRRRKLCLEIAREPLGCPPGLPANAITLATWISAFTEQLPTEHLAQRCCSRATAMTSASRNGPVRPWRGTSHHTGGVALPINIGSAKDKNDSL
jgi:hypothetical protein